MSIDPSIGIRSSAKKASSSHTLTIVSLAGGCMSIWDPGCNDLPNGTTFSECPGSSASSVEFTRTDFHWGGWIIRTDLPTSICVYVDGVLVADTNCAWFHVDVPGYCEDFVFAMASSSIGHLEKGLLRFGVSLDCSLPYMYYPAYDDLVLSIPSGAQYGNFGKWANDTTWVDLGTTLSVKGVDVHSLSYAANGTDTPVGGDSVTIQAADASGIVKRHTFFVRHLGPISINEQLSDTMSVGSSQSVLVSFATADGNAWSPYPYSKLKYTLLEDKPWLAFVDPYTEDLSTVVDNASVSRFGGTSDQRLMVCQDIGDTTRHVTLRVEGKIPEIISKDTVITLVPQKYPKLQITVHPSLLRAGDTAAVSIKKITTDQVLHSYDTTETFDATLLTGTASAYLLSSSGSDTGQTLLGTRLGFKLVARDSLALDSTAVVLQVEHQAGDVAARVTGILSSSKSTKAATPGAKTSSAGKSTIQNTDLDYAMGVGQEVVERFSVVIVDPAQGSTSTLTICGTPLMPTIKASARVRGRSDNLVTYSWKFKLRWEYTQRDGRIGNLVDEFSETFLLASDTCSWTIPWETKVRGGWIDSLSVSANLGIVGTKVMCTRADPYRILGLNATNAVFKANTNLDMQVVLYKESNFRQFTDSLPIRCGSGYGIAELDPPRNNEQFWNWRENRAGGILWLASCTTNAKEYAGRMRKAHPGFTIPDLTTDQLIYESFQEYNGGNYWKLHVRRKNIPSDQTYWFADPPVGNGPNSHGYGKHAHDLYINAQNGIFPSDWNTNY